jgi:PIN domain nuclease of toxin-antitoxin system
MMFYRIHGVLLSQCRRRDRLATGKSSFSTENGLAVENLPLHHADPFDRMLVAQAQVERLTLVTRDERILDYAVATIKA